MLFARDTGAEGSSQIELSVMVKLCPIVQNKKQRK